MPRLAAVFAFIFFALSFVKLGAEETVDDIMHRCPSAAEIAAIDKAVTLRFEADSSEGGGFVCHAADGSGDLTLFKQRVYQMYVIASNLAFDVSPPWTKGKTFYEWLTGAILGVRFRSDIQNASCCSPKGFVNIPAANAEVLNQMQRWLDPDIGGAGLYRLFSGISHEARHNEGFPHTCGDKDQTIQELGAFGVEYYLAEWQAYHTKGSFMDAKDGPYLGFYRDESWWTAVNLERDAAFCDTTNGIAISPRYGLTFGLQAVGTVSSVQTVAVTATTTSTIFVHDAAVGDGVSDFEIASTNCKSATLPPSCVVEIVFRPHGFGPRAAKLFVSNSAGGVSLQRIALTGQGIPFAVSIIGMVNAASYLPEHEIIPGELAAIFGENLSLSAALAATLPLPTTLQGVTVALNGVPVPISYASPSQINVQIPWELHPEGMAALSVNVSTPDGKSIASDPFMVDVSARRPALFSLTQDGTGYGAILIANTGVLAAPTGMLPSSRPVKRGIETLEIYATGLGTVTNVPTTGSAAHSSPLSETTNMPTVIIGGIPVHVLFSGLAPNFVGLYQVNVEVPGTVPTGNSVVVVLSMNGTTANTVTIAVE